MSRVTWAAAAGKLQLAATKGDQDMLKPNTCLEEIYVSAKDSALVQESLELLVAILKLRPLLLGDYNLIISYYITGWIVYIPLQHTVTTCLL